MYYVLFFALLCWFATLLLEIIPLHMLIIESTANGVFMDNTIACMRYNKSDSKYFQGKKIIIILIMTSKLFHLRIKIKILVAQYKHETYGRHIR